MEVLLQTRTVEDTPPAVTEMDQETRRLGRVGDAGRLTDAFPASSAAHKARTHTKSNAQDVKREQAIVREKHWCSYTRERHAGFV